MSKAYTGTLPILPKRKYFKKGDKGEQVKLLQKYLNWANTGSTVAPLVIDGEVGDLTLKAVKFFEQVHHLKPVDGEFGQKCFDCAKKVKMNNGLKATNWAYAIINTKAYHYKKWKSDDVNTHECPVCHKMAEKYKGWNCIGFVTAAYYHGAGMRTLKCSCSGLGDNSFFEHVTLKKWRDRNGVGWDMLTNGGVKDGKSIDGEYLKAGDVLICYNTNGRYQHTAMYAGDGKYVDCTSGRTEGTGEGTYKNLAKRLHVTRVFRPH